MAALPLPLDCPAPTHLAALLWVLSTKSQLARTALQASLVDATAAFLQRGAQGQLEHARPLVQWLVQAAASPVAPVRAAVLRRSALFAEPQVWVFSFCCRF